MRKACYVNSAVIWHQWIHVYQGAEYFIGRANLTWGNLKKSCGKTIVWKQNCKFLLFSI